MDGKSAIVDRIKQANNILLTVSTNPSVDQLAACIGLTLALNKFGKHATAVFSGEVPNAIEFLEPERTIEKNTDSLRDFIISLDKSKADKLRYKVEDTVVKIFITPYRTSISDKDLEFSQGDFNVDIVLALGVHQQADLDQAITSHGRILHDATVANINVKAGGELGTIHWVSEQSSCLCELAAQLTDDLDQNIIDGQIATAFLTGIVAETKRFSNEKTSPQTMSISARLMSSGANQQLVATQLEEPSPEALAAQDESAADATSPDTTAAGAAKPIEPLKSEQGPKKDENGTLEIKHIDLDHPEEATAEAEKAEEPLPEVRIDEQGTFHNMKHEPDASATEKPKKDEKKGADAKTPASPASPAEPVAPPSRTTPGSHMILEPPTMGGQLTANTSPEIMGSSDPLSLPQPTDPAAGFSSPASAITTPSTPVAFQGHDSAVKATNANDQTGKGQDVPAPKPAANGPAPLPEPATPPADVSSARNAVQKALADQPAAPPAIQALNAAPLGEPLHEDGKDAPVKDDAQSQEPGTTHANGKTPPPPVPPPFMPGL